MNRIDQKFKELKSKNKKALICFITAGDPDIEKSVGIALAMEKAGADIIEFGIPYSDPIAEGPVVQRANLRALSGGLKIGDVMNAVKKLREKSEVPLAYLLYYNIILQYGPDRFFSECKEAGVDALIIPDLPFEESGEIKEFTEKYGVYQISLVAPTSEERIEKIAKSAKGFLYCVSSLGVTGTRSSFSTDFEKFFGVINKFSAVPTALGFGISTPEHIRALKKYADGLIVGSAIVKKIEENTGNEVGAVSEFVGKLREALN
jgi:tryptophan synthase, alpha subunit